jgi:hypothetical protein
MDAPPVEEEPSAFCSCGLGCPLRGDPSSKEFCLCRFAGCELGDRGPRAGMVDGPPGDGRRTGDGAALT